MAQWLVNVLLTLPDLDGWADRLLIARVPKGVVTYVIQVKLGSPPLTLTALETAHTKAAKSQEPFKKSARREVARRR